MAMLFRRRSVASSCFRFLHDALLHQSHEGSSPLSWPLRSPSGNRNFSRCSRITELAAHFLNPKPSRTTRPIWRPESGRWIRSAYSGQSTHNDQEEVKAPEGKKGVGSGKLVLYRAKWIRPIRLLVRLKLIQFGGVMALAVPLAEYTQQGSLSLGTTLAVGGVVGGAGAASTALWYYSRRLIGEMALLLPDLRIMQISVLDFWGNREEVVIEASDERVAFSMPDRQKFEKETDTSTPCDPLQDLHYDVSDVLPPLKGMTKEELEQAARQIVIPLDVVGGRQFFLSLRHGYLVHKELLFSILNDSVETRDLKNLESRI